MENYFKMQKEYETIMCQIFCFSQALSAAELKQGNKSVMTPSFYLSLFSPVGHKLTYAMLQLL